MNTKKDISINCSVERVWGFILNPDNRHQWIAGLAHSCEVKGKTGEKGCVTRNVLMVNNSELEFREEIQEVTDHQILKIVFTSRQSSTILTIKFLAAAFSTTVFFHFATEWKGIRPLLLSALWQSDIEKRISASIDQLKLVIENDAVFITNSNLVEKTEAVAL